MNDKAVIRYDNGTDEFYTLYKNTINTTELIKNEYKT